MRFATTGTISHSDFYIFLCLFQNNIRCFKSISKICTISNRNSKPTDILILNKILIDYIDLLYQ